MENKLNFFPKVAIIPVTYRCNSKCVMCNIWKDDQKDMEMDHLLNVFDDPLLAQNIESINLTGGELTLRKDVYDIIKGLLERCHKLRTVTINSNGFLPERLKRLVSNILDLKQYYQFDLYCYLSIDGMSDTHDLVRGVNGSYSKVWDSLNILKSLKKEHDFRFSVNFTINRVNYKELYEVYNNLKKMKIKMDFTYGMRSPIYFQNDELDSLDMDSQLIRDHVADFIAAIKNEGLLTNSLSYYKDLVNMLKGSERKIGCIFSNSGFFLHPNGDVYRCWIYDKKIGNVYNQSFSQIWTSLLAKETEEGILDRCKTCYNNCYAQFKRIDSINSIITNGLLSK